MILFVIVLVVIPFITKMRVKSHILLTTLFLILVLIRILLLLRLVKQMLSIVLIILHGSQLSSGLMVSKRTIQLLILELIMTFLSLLMILILLRKSQDISGIGSWDQLRISFWIKVCLNSRLIRPTILN